MPNKCSEMNARDFPTITSTSATIRNFKNSNRSGRHEEDAGDLRLDVAIEVSHGAFVLEIGGGPDAAQDVSGTDGAGVMDEELGTEAGDLDARKVAGGFAKQFEALVDAEGRLFVWIDADGNREAVEEADALLDHPKVTDGERVEGAGIDAVLLR